MDVTQQFNELVSFIEHLDKGSIKMFVGLGCIGWSIGALFVSNIRWYHAAYVAIVGTLVLCI